MCTYPIQHPFVEWYCQAQHAVGPAAQHAIPQASALSTPLLAVNPLSSLGSGIGKVALIPNLHDSGWGGGGGGGEGGVGGGVGGVAGSPKKNRQP